MTSQELENEFKRKKIRPTAMRELVLKLLMEQDTAISLADLETKLFPADKSTLFRTLKTFEDKKLIHAIDDGTGIVKYALCKDNCELEHEDLHVHFLCTHCEQTFCLNDISVPTINLPHGFFMEHVNMVVKGVCINCKK